MYSNYSFLKTVYLWFYAKMHMVKKIRTTKTITTTVIEITRETKKWILKFSRDEFCLLPELCNYPFGNH